MAWPQTFSIASGIGKNGSEPSLLAWGTEGIMTGVIVKSLRSTPMIEEVKIEQGGGLTATQILIDDGDEIEITVVDDRSLTFPDTGTTVVLFNPQPTGGTIAAGETMMVVNNNYNLAAKAAGERTILAKVYTLITPTNM